MFPISKFMGRVWKNEGVWVHILGYGGRDGTKLQKGGVGVVAGTHNLTYRVGIGIVQPMPQRMGRCGVTRRLRWIQ